MNLHWIMVNLMTMYHSDLNMGKLTKKIEKYFDSIEDDARDYIGASSIGSDCYRQIWYQFKGVKAEKVPGRFRRIWDTGHKLESLVIEWLIKSDVRVSVTDETYHAINMPYFQGHVDGFIKFGKKVSILEIKTAKHASFTIFKSKGLKVWNPQYYAQVQAYMGMSGVNSAYILVLNKDNSEISDEFVAFDSDFYEELCLKAEMIYRSTIEPPRINGSALFYKCKCCKYNKVCHK